jgi:hypothetical protein
MTRVFQIKLMSEDAVADILVPIPDEIPDFATLIFADGAMQGIMAYINSLGGIPEYQEPIIISHKHRMQLRPQGGLGGPDIFWVCKDEDCMKNVSISKEIFYGWMLARDGG